MCEFIDWLVRQYAEDSDYKESGIKEGRKEWGWWGGGQNIFFKVLTYKLLHSTFFTRAIVNPLFIILYSVFALMFDLLESIILFPRT